MRLWSGDSKHRVAQATRHCKGSLRCIFADSKNQ